MNKRWLLGTVFGIEIWFTLRSLLLSGVLWLLFIAVAVVWLELPAGAAIVAGFTAVCLHWLGDLLHHFGHAWAARRVGYPMKKVVSWMILFSSRYPKDEPPLHAKIHIRRALGGPAMSLLITLLSGLLLLLISPGSRVFYFLTIFVFAENLLVFFLGAFLPVGFTDGSTLLAWWPRRNDPTT